MKKKHKITQTKLKRFQKQTLLKMFGSKNGSFFQEIDSNS